MIQQLSTVRNSQNKTSHTQPTCLDRHQIHLDLGYILDSYNHKNVPIRMGLYTYYNYLKSIPIVRLHIKWTCDDSFIMQNKNYIPPGRGREPWPIVYTPGMWFCGFHRLNLGFSGSMPPGTGWYGQAQQTNIKHLRLHLHRVTSWELLQVTTQDWICLTSLCSRTL